MDEDRSDYLPWTTERLYDWMKSRIGGIELRPGGSYRCQVIDGEKCITVGTQNDINRDFDRTWQGIAGNIGLYAHEARHVDGYGLVSCCGISNGCDQNYDISDLTSYGIQW